ncbi:hypothetical protein COY62_04455 [bacterium (Candidatus Howlettbacteria) CG_4_10_14_0_8_um_filter_40_9]|nr:MAG: hypothetical protein COY62_04455 [bacterium (Candidatus Howlettbacteria) CG_4_10_14_0_8_um_filter_40_9]
MKNYYAILGLPRSATGLEIKKAYQKKALLLHPDINSKASTYSEMSEINEAYSVLCDIELKGKYDAIFISNLSRSGNTIFSDHTSYFDTKAFSEDWNDGVRYRKTIFFLWVLLLLIFGMMAFFLYKTDPNILNTKSSNVEENNLFPEDINPKEIREPSGVTEPVIREI